MAKRVLKEKPVAKKASVEVVEQTEQTDQAEQTRSDEIKAETDALLDEIDGLLEVDAATMVREFVQKGGE